MSKEILYDPSIDCTSMDRKVTRDAQGAVALIGFAFGIGLGIGAVVGIRAAASARPLPSTSPPQLPESWRDLDRPSVIDSDQVCALHSVFLCPDCMPEVLDVELARLRESA